MKTKTRWYSDRVQSEVTVARWGEVGTPLLIFPTAGGDAEEIERFLMIETLSAYLTEGRVKVYSCDSVAGRVMLAEEGPPQHRMRILNQFQEFVYHEVVPAIRADCKSEDIGIAVTGASIGAFNALACLCRYPDAFTHAVCMSGTYDLQRFLQGPVTKDLQVASPLHFLSHLSADHLALLRTRLVLLPSGEGRAEDIGESWRVAKVLGDQRIPNRVDSWGADWHHDWPTWRNMLVRYVEEIIPTTKPSL